MFLLLTYISCHFLSLSAMRKHKIAMTGVSLFLLVHLSHMLVFSEYYVLKPHFKVCFAKKANQIPTLAI